MIFDFCFLIEDIAKAFEKAEEEIKDGFWRKMVKELDEKTFIRYMEEWYWKKLSKIEKEWLLESFRTWEFELIWFSEFWEKFNRNRVKINWLEIKVWWYYVYKDGKYVLSDEIETLYPKNRNDKNR